MSFDFGSALNSVFPGTGNLYNSYFGNNNQPPNTDYSAAALNQGGFNKDAALTTSYLSNPNIYTPYGSRTVNWNPETGHSRVNINLSPGQQRLFDRQQHISERLGRISQGALDRVGTTMGRPFNPNLNDWTTSANGGPIQRNVAGAGEAARNSVENALYARQTSRLDPQFAQSEDNMRSKLAAQGLHPGTEAYDREMQNFGRTKNDAYANARNDAITAGGAEQQHQFGMNLQSGQFHNTAQGQDFTQNMQNAQLGNAARGQQFGEATFERNLPMTELNALRTGSAPQQYNFQPYAGSQMAPTPWMTGQIAQGQQSTDIYNANVGSQNSQNQMLGQGAMAAAMYFSDVRLKTNLVPAGKLPSGLPLWEFEYVFARGRRYIGVLAQQVLNFFPEAVVVFPSGFMAVNYARIG